MFSSTLLRRVAGLAGVLLLAGGSAFAQKPVSHETTAVSNTTAVGLLTTTTTPAGPPVSQCDISVENGAIRFWVDGTAPTGTTGHLVAAGGPPIVLATLDAVTGFQAIAVNQAAVLQTTCSRGATPVVVLVFAAAPGLLPPCNGVQRTNCTAKGF